MDHRASCEADVLRGRIHVRAQGSAGVGQRGFSVSLKYRTILADPPWPMKRIGSYLRARHVRPATLVYPTMTIADIKAIPVGDMAETGAHCWLWVVNQLLREGFEVMESWGFKYHTVITWAKGSGMGNYFINHTEHILFGYKDRCEFNKARYIPNIYYWPKACRPNSHSRKPAGSYELIESVSDKPRLELFARPITPMFPKIDGWHVFGNEVESDVKLTTELAESCAE